MSKDELKRTIKRTTYEMTAQNHNYRKVYLSKIKDDDIYLSRSQSSFDGSGFEMLYIYGVQETEDGVIAYGEFQMDPWLKVESTLFVGVFIVADIYSFLTGSFVLSVEISILILLPLIFLWKMLPKIVAIKRGRKKILDYVENELGGKIEIVEMEKP